MKLRHVLALALAAAVAPNAFADGKGPTSKTDRSETAVPAAAAGTTSLACYFQKGSDITWYWGLNSDKSWYGLPGEWQKTPQTKLEKFFTSTNQAAILAACSNSQTYYGLVGYSLMAAFASQKSAGFNYPIIINGNTELWPQY